METIINYFNEGHNTSEIFVTFGIIVTFIICIEKTIQWIYKKFLVLYKKKRGLEDEASIINNNTEQIKELTETINKLAVCIADIDKDGKRRDRSLMRDRLVQGMRYFSQQTDEKGIVHISMTDYENLNEMFKEYFKCDGNGVCHSLYENEFKNFKIDTERKY